MGWRRDAGKLPRNRDKSAVYIYTPLILLTGLITDCAPLVLIRLIIWTCSSRTLLIKHHKEKKMLKCACVTCKNNEVCSSMSHTFKFTCLGYLMCTLCKESLYSNIFSFICWQNMRRRYHNMLRLAETWPIDWHLRTSCFLNLSQFFSIYVVINLLIVHTKYKKFILIIVTTQSVYNVYHCNIYIYQCLYTVCA